MTPNPVKGFHVCHSCDPPRLVPNEGMLAHLTEHHLSVKDIQSAEVVEADDSPEFFEGTLADGIE